jgi:monoamine oxidase
MAEMLKERVLLSSPVTRIVDTPASPLTVQTDQYAIECGRVIVAMMPADMRKIEFEPKLPEKRHGLISDWKASPSYKAHLVYETPFWRKSKLSGIAVGDGKSIDFVFDVTPASGSPGILVAFGAGDELPSDARARKEAVVGALVDYFAEDAQAPINFVEMDWYSDKWSSGCASPLGPKVLTKYGTALREPVGRIHWAGSDTAVEFDGSMEGAVRAGERAAKEVAKALQAGNPQPTPAKSG